MFTLRTPKLIKETDIKFAPAVLEAGSCGLFRAPLNEAADLMPSMAELLATSPVNDPENWEVDIKVHMLMPGQYPCIPNWHTDMVPRDESGLRFDLIDHDNPPMYLWISAGPETEFLAEEVIMPRVPGSHLEIANWIRYADSRMTRHGYDWLPDFKKQALKPNAWYSMDQQTAHRGTIAKSHGWRVFIRLTHKSMAPHRPQISVQRRHAQVYLDVAQFGW